MVPPFILFLHLILLSKAIFVLIFLKYPTVGGYIYKKELPSIYTSLGGSTLKSPAIKQSLYNPPFMNHKSYVLPQKYKASNMCPG